MVCGMKNLRDVDLNLLVVFREVLHTRHISAAAERLGMSQPAVSNALRRLREVLGGDLFVRAGAGMQPTPLAEQLAEPVGAALATLQDALLQRPGFDAASSRRGFTLAMTDVGEVHFMPTLMQQCAQHAPGVRLNVVHARGPVLRGALQDGEVDLAIGAYDDMPGNLFQQKLFQQDCAVLFRAGNPLGAQPLTLARFRQARHLLVTEAASPYSQILQRLDKAGIALADHRQTPSMLAAPFIVAATDLVVTVPSRLALQVAAPLGLQWARPPLPLPVLQTHCFWHRRFHEDAGNRWLRARVAELFVEA